MGALVGGCHANNQLDKLEEWANSLTRRRVVSYLDVRLGGSGLINGGRLGNLLGKSLGTTLIEDLPMRFGAIATEIGTGHEVWLTRGSLSLAIRASYALPGVFPPVSVGGRWLVDGALVNPVPVSAARALGARVVIAVNLDADRFSRGATIASHGADPGDAISVAPTKPDGGFRRLRSMFGAERALRRELIAGPARPSFSTVMIESLQHHAGSSHPHAARRRSAQRAHHAAHRAHRLVGFSSCRGIHRSRPRSRRESVGFDQQIRRRPALMAYHCDGDIRAQVVWQANCWDEQLLKHDWPAVALLVVVAAPVGGAPGTTQAL